MNVCITLEGEYVYKQSGVSKKISQTGDLLSDVIK